MNRIKRAVILAAGMGNRMRPVSEFIPKPLIKVHGKRMIESIIEGLNTNGITEIYIVVGYKKELFEFLPNKYKGIKLLHNDYYEECNNISSLYVARDYLEDAFVIDGDQIINNVNILNPEYTKSGYSAKKIVSHTDEWVLQVRDGNIIDCSRDGGDSGWQLYSISRWSKEDGIKLRKHIEIEFEKGNRQIYWDDVALFVHNQDYKLTVYEIYENDLIEVDNYSELLALDDSYRDFKGTIK